MAYAISLVIGSDGSTFAHFHELMGCFVLARNKERARTKAQLAIVDYLEWLRSHGETVSVRKCPNIVIAEEVHVVGNVGDAGGPDPLLRCDYSMANDECINRCLTLLKFARSDLLQIISKIPTNRMRYKPEGEPRSIGNTIRHIASVDLWYLSRIRALPRHERPKDIFEFLEYARATVQTVLPRLTDEQRKKVFYSSRSLQISTWTATKVLHRLVTHERQHTSYLRRILALPGSPLMQQ